MAAERTGGWKGHLASHLCGLCLLEDAGQEAAEPIHDGTGFKRWAVVVLRTGSDQAVGESERSERKVRGGGGDAGIVP